MERCLRVREHVGSSSVGGRSGEPTGSGGSGAGAFEKELKGLRGGASGNAGLLETDFETYPVMMWFPVLRVSTMRPSSDLC